MGTPEVLSLDMLKGIHEEVLTSQISGNVNEHIASSLEITALDDENVRHLGELLQRKRYAFECLRAISFKFSEDFILVFYDSIISSLQLVNSELVENAGIAKFNDYMNSSSPLEEKLLLLQSFLICMCESDITFSLFEQFSPHYWRRKLLLFALFKKNDALDINTIELMTKATEELNEFFVVNGFHWSIDDFLEKMICHPNLNIYFTLEVFLIVRLQPEIFYILGRDAALCQEKINEIKYMSLLQHCSIAELLFENYFDTMQYILTFPFPTLLNFVKNISSDNFKQIISFIELLRNSGFEHKNRDEFLDAINFDGNLDTLKSKLIFNIVKGIISTLFPCYNSYKGNQVASKTVKVDVECRCFDPYMNCKFHKSQECCNLLYSLNSLLAKLMIHFTNAEIILDTVGTILTKINNSKQMLALVNALEILEEYHVNLDESEFNNLFLNSTSENYEHKVHQTVVESSFSGTYEKSSEQAIEEIENNNPGITLNIIELYIEVSEAFENRSCLLPNEDRINTWSKDQIKLWASLVRTVNVRESEKLAVLKRLFKVTLGLSLRDVQLLVVIAIIKSNKGKGRLCQVNTGEGKTLIIAMVAAFKVLEGHTVDIYTSSPVLAIPQSLEFTEFYKTCTISVTNNIAPKSDYTCDIIYGTNSSFQRDVLCGEFRKSSVRKNRKFEIAIVDEVDNMLIDGNNWILKLTCDMPAMDHLEPVLAAIYIQINAVASAFIEKNGVVYFRQEEEAFEENGELKPEVKYRDIPIESKRNFIIRCTNTHIRKLIRDTENEAVEEGYPEIKIPKHLRQIVTKKQLSSWIDNAVQSIFNYAQDEDYVLYDGKITVVDTNNTGVLKKNTTWSNGLHQFLQMKHGAKVAPENFTSNFISNVALFSRYSSIFGLTGTLGSKDTRTFLHETYDVDSVIIPPFKLKQHKILKPIILRDRESWLFKIAQNCIQKLNEGRSVLIIMNYIKETEELANVFKEQFNYKNTKIKLYTTDDNLKVVEVPMNPGDVIITTNIAGRGTDIKLHKSIEKNGGLHVCLTFLPINSRVEEQNIGRTSRNGNRGTSQLILLVPGNDSTSIDDLKKIRSEKETSQIKRAANTVKRIKVKDKIFRQFCDCLNEIQGRNSMVKESELKSVEEQFAFWIKMHEDEFDKTDSSILEKFDEFKQSIMEDNRNGTLIKNPYLYVELGNNYLEKDECHNAISEYTNAINLDENFAENAYYNRAWAYLKLYGNDNDYIHKAVSDFKTTRKLISDKENCLHLMQTASSSDVFSEQIMNKLSLYNIQKNVIEMAIGPDKDAVNEQLKEVESHIKKTDDSKLKENLISVRTKLKEDKENIGVIGRAMETNRDIKIEPLPDDFIKSEDKKKYEQELEEFERNGWLKGYKITEVKPIDWLSVISLLGIGFGQLVIGAAITVFSLGAGSTIGMGLITEGVSDIITAVKDGIINRDFDWVTWGLMKIISLTVSVVCAGLKAIKDVARTACSGVKNLATSGFKAFNKMTSEGFKIAAKTLGFELSKGVAKEIVTQLANYGIDKSLIPLIEEAIIELIRGPIENALSTNSKVISMLKLDVENKNHAYENQIRAIGLNLLNPKQNSIIKILAMHTVSCISGNLGLGTLHKVLTIIKGSVDFTTFTFDFISELNKGIDKVELKEEEDNSIANPVQENQKEESLEEFKKQSNNDDIDLNKVNVQDEQVQQNRKQCTPSDLSCEFAGLVSTNMIQIMKGSIVSPITQMAVSYSVDKLSSKIHTSLETEREKYRAGKRICDDNNREYENTSSNNTTAQLSEEHVAEVNALIEQLESGGPVTLFHLGALSKAADAPIEVYDHNGDLMFPIRNNQGGEPIKLQYHGKENDVGHFTLLGKSEPFVMGSGDNMCAFNCIAQLSNKDPNQLRADTINILRSNKHVVAGRLDDIKMIETAQNSVFSIKGGAQYDGSNYLDAIQYIQNSQGKHGFDNINPGHPKIHISHKGGSKS